MTDLKKSFQISSSEAKFYLGLEIAQEKDGIKITQKVYIDNILRKFYMKKANPEGTPIVKCSQNIESGKAEGKFPYCVAVGALMYVMVGTRPDIIAYAVGVATRSLENLTEDDIMKVKMIFRYLRGTVSHGIKYQVNSVKALEAYSDADHAGDLASRRSTTLSISRRCYFLVQSKTSICFDFNHRGWNCSFKWSSQRISVAKEALCRVDSDWQTKAFFVDNEAAIS